MITCLNDLLIIKEDFNETKRHPQRRSAVRPAGSNFSGLYSVGWRRHHWLYCLASSHTMAVGSLHFDAFCDILQFKKINMIENF